MKKSLEQMCDKLEEEEETIVLELLDLTSPELIQSYKHKVRQRHDYISKHYGEEYSTDEGEDEIQEDQEAKEYYRREKEETRGLGSKQVWQDAGFEVENDNY